MSHVTIAYAGKVCGLKSVFSFTCCRCWKLPRVHKDILVDFSFWSSCPSTLHTGAKPLKAIKVAWWNRSLTNPGILRSFLAPSSCELVQPQRGSVLGCLRVQSAERVINRLQHPELFARVSQFIVGTLRCPWH